MSIVTLSFLLYSLRISVMTTCVCVCVVPIPYNASSTPAPSLCPYSPLPISRLFYKHCESMYPSQHACGFGVWVAQTRD